MAETNPNPTLKPGQRAPVSGFYECDTGCGHRYSTDVAGHVLPPLPQECGANGWRLAQQRPTEHT